MAKLPPELRAQLGAVNPITLQRKIAIGIGRGLSHASARELTTFGTKSMSYADAVSARSG